MDYIVRQWVLMNDGPHTDFFEVKTKEDAIQLADQRSEHLKQLGYDFDIMIYECTNY